MKKCIAVMAFAVIFLAAVFLFMRNYPSDRWFSGVFIVAGGVSLWCVWGAAGAADAVKCAETTTDMAGTHTNTEDNVEEMVAVIPQTDPVVTDTK